MSALQSRTILNPAERAEFRNWLRYLAIARITAFVAILASPFAFWALFWTSPRDYPFLSSMFLLPLLIYGCVLLFSRVWRGDKFVRLLFGAGMAIRIAAAGAFVWMGFFVFNVSADAFHYWTMGLFRGQSFSGMGWKALPPPWTSTNLICNLCALFTVVMGNAMPTEFVLFAFAALWGGFFFYRAFCIAFPSGDRGLYGLLVVLLPSIVYWSSAIGKDALEQLFIGISAYGFARIVKQLNARAIVICLIGLVGAGMVRPHVGAMLAISMLVPFTVGRAHTSWLVTSAKILLAPVLAAGTYVMVSQAQQFVGVEGSDFKSNVARLKIQNQNTATGGSSFGEGESLSRRLVQSPFLPFRPFPWEVHNAVSAVAALEGLALLGFVWWKRHSVRAFVKHWREAYVLFVLIFFILFSVIFSAGTSNFGILVRERIMLLPIFFMMFCARLPQEQASRIPAIPRRKLRGRRQFAYSGPTRPLL